jgi:hypothetical protein
LPQIQKEDILKAKIDVNEKTMIPYHVTKHFGILKTAIHNWQHRASERIGRITDLHNHQTSSVHWRSEFPMDNNDLKYLIKAYLDQGDRTIRLINNVPGPDFVSRFYEA